MRGVTGALLWLMAARLLAVDADGILGTWLTEDRYGNRDSVVEIVRSGEEYAGHVVWMRHSVYGDDDPKGMAGQPIRDRENPNPSLRDRPILGIGIVSGLRFDGERWIDGRIYSPRQGTSYAVKAWLEDADTLKVRGFIGISLLGETVTWQRSAIPTDDATIHDGPK